jgi:hypothetical protein
MPVAIVLALKVRGQRKYFKPVIKEEPESVKAVAILFKR